jgi:hypothetical protein
VCVWERARQLEKGVGVDMDMDMGVCYARGVRIRERPGTGPEACPTSWRTPGGSEGLEERRVLLVVEQES